MSGPAAKRPQPCDATILDSGRPRQCQKDDGHHPATRHRSVLRNGDDILTWNDDAKDSTPASSSPPRAVVRPSRYTVTCVPPDTAPDAHVWAITVEEQRDGRWIANHMGSWLTADGDWEIGYSGAYRACAHSLDTAMRLATQAAPLVVINGFTVADAVARSKEQ